MTKKDFSQQILAADLAFKQIERDLRTTQGALPSQEHLLEHLKAITAIAQKATKKLIKSKKGGTPVTTHSPAAYQALQNISAAATVLAEVAGLIEKRKSKVTKL
jgi:hypothetical protein